MPLNLALILEQVVGEDLTRLFGGDGPGLGGMAYHTSCHNR